MAVPRKCWHLPELLDGETKMWFAAQSLLYGVPGYFGLMGGRYSRQPNMRCARGKTRQTCLTRPASFLLALFLGYIFLRLYPHFSSFTLHACKDYFCQSRIGFTCWFISILASTCDALFRLVFLYDRILQYNSGLPSVMRVLSTAMCHCGIASLPSHCHARDLGSMDVSRFVLPLHKTIDGSAFSTYHKRWNTLLPD